MNDIVAFDSTAFFKDFCLGMPLQKLDEKGNVLFKTDKRRPDEYRLISLSADSTSLSFFEELLAEDNRLMCICLHDDLSEVDIDFFLSLPLDVCWLVSFAVNENTKKRIKAKFGNNVLIYIPEFVTTPQLQTVFELYLLKKKSKKFGNIVWERDEYKNGILAFMQFVSEVRNIEIHSMLDLYKYLAESTINFFRAETGAFVSVNHTDGNIKIEYAKDNFIPGDEFFSHVETAIKERDIISCGERNLASLRMAGQTEYVLVIDKATTYKESFIFNSVLRSISLICNNAILTYNIDAISKEEKINTLDSISSTINHYANNALASVKGFALELEHVDDIGLIKRNLKFIYDSCNIVEAVIKTLTHLNYDDLHNTINIPILHLSIINIEEKLKEEIAKIKKEDEERLRDDVVKP